MEPITHMLTGAVLARSGLNRKAAYMTAAMVIAAELPDIDTVWSVFWPATGFGHHRGITHTFVGVPFEAALVMLGCWAFYRLRHGAGESPPSRAWLFIGSLLALLSHLLLDWTNNYGLRPFFPFNPRWYAGSFVFIFEPVMFVLLAGALIAPLLFGLINSEVGVRKETFRGRGWAIAALIGVAAMYGWRYVEHGRAIRIATEDAAPETTSVFASPHPVDPFTWSTVSDTPESYQLGTVDTRRGIALPHSASDTIYKAPATLAILAAKRSQLGRIYLDWSKCPVISESDRQTDPAQPRTEVTFEDARFMYDVFGLKMRENVPMKATLTLNMAAPEGQRVVEMKMGERVEK